MNQPYVYICLGFPGGSNGKDSACNAGDAGSVLGSERSPREGNGNPVQYSCLENPMDREAWQASMCPWGHKELVATQHDIHMSAPS